MIKMNLSDVAGEVSGGKNPRGPGRGLVDVLKHFAVFQNRVFKQKIRQKHA